VDPEVDICCCATPSGEKCNWLICIDCFTKVTYDLKASHQMYGLQVTPSSMVAYEYRGADFTAYIY
jgi:hypothetical protein